MLSRFLIIFTIFVLISGCATPPPDPEEVAKEMYSRETLLGSAERAIQNGNRVKALAIYRELLARDGSDKQAMGAAALLAREVGEYDLSATYHEKLLELMPGDVEIRQSLAEVNILRQHYNDAESALTTLTVENPNNWQAWNALGLISDLYGNYSDSVTFYTKAIAANPSNADIYNNRGYSLIMSHDYPEAERTLREGLRYDASNPRLNNNLLIALAWLGRYDEAVVAGRISLDEWTAYNNVGYIAQLRGEYETAIQLYNKALSSSPRFYPTAADNLETVQSLLEKRK